MSGSAPRPLEAYKTIGGETYWWCWGCEKWHREEQLPRKENLMVKHHGKPLPPKKPQPSKPKPPKF